jgi:hypothetical protein
MHKVFFVFVVGIVTGYLVAGYSDSGVALKPRSSTEEPNVVTERPLAENQKEREVDETRSVLTDERVGLRLTYRTEPNGYVVHAHPADESNPTFVKGYQFMLASDLSRARDEATEGPATIDVRVYKNTDRLAPSVWAKVNPLQSNIELARSDLEEDVVGGANATRYLVDGLYLIETVVVAHANMIYVVTGAYTTEDDPTFADFEPFLRSIEFLPLP